MSFGRLVKEVLTTEPFAEPDVVNVVDGLFAIADALNSCADALNRLGIADASTPFGAIEALARVIEEGFDRLSGGR